MKRTGLMLLALCAAAALPSHADEWTKTFTITGKPVLHIETSDANIRIDTWDQNTIEAKVTTTRDKIGQGGIQVEDRQNGDSVEIEVRYPHGGIHFGIGNHRVDVSIHMPHEGHVNLHTGDGNIEIAGLKGEMDLRGFPPGWERILAGLDTGSIQVLPLVGTEAKAIGKLMNKYKDIRPQFADAALVYLAHREQIDTIFTLERRDFSIYRNGRGRPFRLVPDIG